MSEITTSDFVSFDLETTGLNTADDKIIQFGVAVFERGQFAARGARLVDPGRLIPKEVTEITGIGDDDVAGHEPFVASLAARVATKFASTPLIVGFNCLSFDMPILRRELAPLTIADNAPVLDVKVFVDWHHRGLRSRKLVTMATDVYTLAVDGQRAHSAATDAQWTGQLLLAMIAKGLVPNDIDAALAAQTAHKKTVDAEFARWSYWIYADRKTQTLRLGAGKYCGYLLSEVPKNYFQYMRGLGDLPAAVVEELIRLNDAPLTTSTVVAEDVQWGGWSS
jgi:DNA polymerase III alpha subunit (gram-positive type)